MSRNLTTNQKDNRGVPTAEIKTYQFELDNFKKGATAPTSVFIGTAPRVTGIKFAATAERLGMTFMIPLDWDTTTDMQMMYMCAIPASSTFTVGDKINLELESRVTRSAGATKLDAAGFLDDISTVSTTSPGFAEHDDTILTAKNTEFYTYTPSINIAFADIGPVGGVYYGEVGLKSIAVGNVPEIVIYQIHINYYGTKQ